MVGISLLFGLQKRLLKSRLGKVIALGYSDGITRICDVNNGKVVLVVSPEAPGFSNISCVGWVDNRPPTNGDQSLEGIDPTSSEGIPKGVLDLEINQMLPRLSVLPNGSGAYANSTFCCICGFELMHGIEMACSLPKSRSMQ